MTETQTCSAYVTSAPGTRSVQIHRCGRPVKDGDLCGIHAAAKRKRDENDRKAAEARRESDRLRDQAQADCDRLAAVGIEARPQYRDAPRWADSGYTGKVVIVTTADELLAIINRTY